MKKLILISLVLFMSGCVTSPKRYTSEGDSARYERKEKMMKCVSEFLVQDVAPGDALSICTTIFSRYEPSIKQTTVQPKNTLGENR